MRYLFPFSCGVLLALSACQTTSTSDNNSIEETQIEETTQTETPSKNEVVVNSVPLLGMYASSTALPTANFHVSNAIDNDPVSNWKTMQGAAPDEGIMLYLLQPTFLQTLQLDFAKGDKLATVEKIRLYINGTDKGEFDATQTMPIEEEANSIYIRISKVSNVSTTKWDNVYQSEVFDKDFAVGIAEIKATDKENKAIQFVAPAYAKGNVEASSTLEPKLAYHVAHLFDSRNDIAWAEGGSTAGENETIKINFDTAQRISAIQFWNGYQRSDEHYTANARIKTFDLNGQTYSLKDEMQTQKIILQTPISAKNLTLIIKEVYQGKKYKDLVVSEIVFFDNEQPLIPQTDSKNQVEELQQQASNSPLATLLDRRLNYQEDDYFQINKSLILRSNGTFVLYKTENSREENSQREVLADGNWEIKEVSPNQAKIRVFGKFIDLSLRQDFYKGTQKKNYLQIFQDYLTITNESVKGEKFIDEFLRK